MEGVVDLSIIGENVLERGAAHSRRPGTASRGQTLKQLDFGGCRLSLAVPERRGLLKACGASPASASRTSYPGCSSASSTSRAWASRA